MASLIEAPSYYKYFNRTYKITRAADGTLVGHELNLRTAEFDLATPLIRRILHDVHADMDRIDEAEFVQATERERAEYLIGDGPIFALYDTVRGIVDQVEREGRTEFEPHEQALVIQLRKKTFQMWEEEFARRAAGEDPRNTVRSALPPTQETGE